MKRRIPLTLAAAIALLMCLAAACGSDTQTSPTPAVSRGSISGSPGKLGLAGATVFTFTATGFTSSTGEPLSYAWDFGDRTAATGGATITHTYMIDWYVFDVSVTASTPGGASARAQYGGVRVRAISGLWGLRDSAGRLLLSSTVLTQNDSTVWGDNSALNCRYGVAGSVSDPRSIVLTYTRPPGDCQGWGLPESFTFAGVADEAIDSFAGMMTPGGPATLTRCPYPAGCS